MDFDTEALCRVLGAEGAVVLTPAALAAALPAILTAIPTAAGFTSAGILGGSLAAQMMAYFGGSVAAGGLVAFLQSLGVAGLSGAGTVLTGGAGGTAGCLISLICNTTATN